MIDPKFRDYVDRSREALLRLFHQGRVEEATPIIEQLEELAVEDLSEDGRFPFPTLGRDEPLLALPKPEAHPFDDSEPSGVITSAVKVSK